VSKIYGYLNIIDSIIIGIASYFIFTIIFYGFNKSVLKLFAPIQKIVNKLKRKKLYENISFFMVIFICVIIRDIYKLKNIKFAVPLGLLIALYSTVFNIGIGKNEDT
jgi:hypothetical protein